MAVRFILGTSGSGKTTFCIKAVADALLDQDCSKSLILLVPEQATYQIERAIFADKRISGFSRLHVLSFDRLQFLLLGKNVARPELSGIARRMVIHKILRENSSNLKIFNKSSSHIGLAEEFDRLISELQQNIDNPGELNEFIKKLPQNNLASLKFSDLNLIFKEYFKFIEGKYIDPDFQKNLIGKTIGHTEFLKDAYLWVDGFSGFNSVELSILSELVRTVPQANVALCLDGSRINLNLEVDEADSTSLFYPTELTYAQLLKIFKENKIEIAAPVILNKSKRFAANKCLSQIEKYLFESAPAKIKCDESIRIIAAANRRQEVSFAASEIQKLIKTKKLRYREIAVIVSDIENYRHYVKAYFEDYRIPFFIDRRKPLNQHPLAGLIISALQAVNNNFLHSDIFAYLKNEFAPLEASQTDIMENYCIAFGIGPEDWKGGRTWIFNDEQNPFDLDNINSIREKSIRPLLKLHQGLEGKIDAKQFTNAVFAFLDEINFSKKLGELIGQANQKNDLAAAEEHQQFYNKFMDIFGQLTEIFGCEKMTSADFPAIIGCAFSQMNLRFIPPALDEVLVGTIERSRHPDLKAVFLLGVTQKEFPVPVSYETILTDSDRIIANSAGLALKTGTACDLSNRQYLAYIAFTRPSEYLYLTFPAGDEDGSELACSGFINSLQNLFDNLKIETFNDEQSDFEFHTAGEVAEFLCGVLGRDNNKSESIQESESLLNDICDDEQFSTLGKFISSAINYDNVSAIDKNLASEIFGRIQKTSSSKLTAFAACPYKYFGRYILKLKERKEFKFEPVDIGEFYHRVLDSVQKNLEKKKKNFANISEPELLEIFNQQSAAIRHNDKFISAFEAQRKHNKHILDSACRSLEGCVLAISEMTRAGQFVSIKSEVVFGNDKTDESLGNFEIKLPGGSSILINGKIDRLDVAKINGKNIALIFDYKSKSRAFDWKQFYYGLDLQLAIYTLAVKQAGFKYGIDDAAGAFYMPIELKSKTADFDELKKTEKFGYKARGIFSGEYFRQLDSKTDSGDSAFYSFYVTKDGHPYGHENTRDALNPQDFESLLQFARNKIIEISQKILSGQINIHPYKINSESACGYCEFKSICRFDWQINEYNTLEPIDKAGVLEKAGTANG